MAVVEFAECADICSSGVFPEVSFDIESGAVEGVFQFLMIYGILSYYVVDVERITDADRHILDICTDVGIGVAHHSDGDFLTGVDII